MINYSRTDQPAITLFGKADSTGAVGVEKYGISDSTGLGPNGSDLFKTYSLTVESISHQPLGDSSVRDTLGLNVGGKYTALDIKNGDFIANSDGTKVFKIVSISSKTDTSISFIYEDVWMSIAKARSDRNNRISGLSSVLFFSLSDDSDPLISPNGSFFFSDDKSIDRIQSYFDVYPPDDLLTLYPSAGIDDLSPGDLITSTGGTGDFYLVKTKKDSSEVVVGSVARIVGNAVIIRPLNKIITNFDSPESLVGGQIGSIWYRGITGGYNLTSTSNNPVFYQITNASPSFVIGDVNNPTFDQTAYSMSINGSSVISQSPTGPTSMPLSSIISEINSKSSATLVGATAENIGGTNVQITSGDGGATLFYGTDLAAILSSSTGPTGNYPAATFEFSITDGISNSITVNPKYSDVIVSGYPGVSASELTNLINTAAGLSGANLSATLVSPSSIKIEETNGGNLTLSNVSPDAFGSNAFGSSSIFGMIQGTYVPPTLEQYLKLFRNDGGEILITGSYVDSPEMAGIYSVSNGIPPYLLVLDPGIPVDVFYQNSDVVPVAIGGITAGRSFPNPTPIQNVIDDLLYPELFPTLTPPSSTFTSSTSGLKEIGEVIGTITFNSSFNRGSINPQYQSDSPFRSGPPNSYEYTGTGLAGTYPSTSLTDSKSISNYAVISGAQTWRGRVNYDGGVQPKTNKGNAYDLPLPAGSTNYITRTITGVYPFFATSSDITVLTKQPLALHNSTYFEFDLQGDSGANKQTFELPEAFSAVTGIQQFSTASNQWQWINGSKAASLSYLNSQFTKTSINKTINSNTVPYYRYVYSGFNIGFREVRLYTN